MQLIHPRLYLLRALEREEKKSSKGSARRVNHFVVYEEKNANKREVFKFD